MTFPWVFVLIFNLAFLSVGTYGLTGLFGLNVAHAAQGISKTLSYQGRLADSDGDLQGGSSGTTFYFKFSIWDNATIATGDQLWPSSDATEVGITVTDGVFNVNVGDTVNGYPDILDYDFNSNETVYLQVEVSSSSGGSFETLSPRQLIGGTAFAQLAEAVSGTSTQSSFGTTSPIGFSQVTIEATTTSSIGLTIRGASGQAVNLFQIQDATDGVDQIVVDNNFQLGVGTTTPFVRLSVGGDAFISGGLSVGTGGSATTTAGHIRGTLLHSDTQIVATGLISCDTIDTDAAGVFKCGNDQTGAGGAGGWIDDGTVVRLEQSDDTVELNILDVVGGTINFGTGAATGTLSSSGANIGIGTTTPSLGFSVGATSTLIGGRLTVEASIKTGDIISTTTLDVRGTGTSSFAGGVNVTTSGGLSSATGLTITGGDILSSGKVTITSSATSSFTGGVNISGDLLSTDINTTGQVSVGGRLTVASAATSTFVGGITATDLTLTQGLRVDSGTAIFDENIIVGGATSSFAGGILGSALISPDSLFVSGSGTSTVIDNNALIKGSLTVRGGVTIDGELDVANINVTGSGTTTISNLNTSTFLDANELRVTGGSTSTFDGGIIATNLRLSDGLHVDTGDAIFDQKITVGAGTSTFAGNVDATNINTIGLTVTGDFTVESTGSSSVPTLLSTNIGVTGLNVTGDDSIQDSEVVDALTINNGSVDGSIIGGSTAAAGTFTTLQANTSLAVGTDTPSSLLSVQGHANVGSLVSESNIKTGDIIATGTITADAIAVTGNATTSFSGGITAVGLTTTGGLRVDTGTVIIDEIIEVAGAGTSSFAGGLDVSGSFLGTDINLTGQLTAGGRLEITGSATSTFDQLPLHFQED